MQKGRTAGSGASKTNSHGGGAGSTSGGPSPEAIARRAYELFEERGRITGHELEDWLAAEAELLRATGMASTPVESPSPAEPSADVVLGATRGSMGPSMEAGPTLSQSGATRVARGGAQAKKRSSERDSTP